MSNQEMRFEWDESKRLATLKKHGIDFIDAIEIFDQPHMRLTGISDTELATVTKLDGYVMRLGTRHLRVLDAPSSA